jgi:hypothetical protein
MSQVIAEACGVPAERIAVLSGPNLAPEIARASRRRRSSRRGTSTSPSVSGTAWGPASSGCTPPTTSPESRSRGRHPGPIDGAIGGVAEGAFIVEAARVLADQLDVDAPIVREVHLALYERKPVRRCLADLLTRETRDEQADAGAWRTALSGH